jgi:hypothetical protein
VAGLGRAVLRRGRKTGPCATPLAAQPLRRRPHHRPLNRRACTRRIQIEHASTMLHTEGGEGDGHGRQPAAGARNAQRVSRPSTAEDDAEMRTKQPPRRGRPRTIARHAPDPTTTPLHALHHYLRCPCQRDCWSGGQRPTARWEGGAGLRLLQVEASGGHADTGGHPRPHQHLLGTHGIHTASAKNKECPRARTRTGTRRVGTVRR